MLAHNPLYWKNAFLPLGISFFTFEFVHYAVDRYRNKTEEGSVDRIPGVHFVFSDHGGRADQALSGFSAEAAQHFARMGDRLAARSHANSHGPGEEIRGRRRADGLHQPLELDGHQPGAARRFCRSGFSRTASRSTRTFRRIRTSPSVRRGCSAFACRKISTGPTCARTSPISGGTGTCRSPTG